MTKCAVRALGGFVAIAFGGIASAQLVEWETNWGQADLSTRGNYLGRSVCQECPGDHPYMFGSWSLSKTCSAADAWTGSLSLTDKDTLLTCSNDFNLTCPSGIRANAESVHGATGHGIHATGWPGQGNWGAAAKARLRFALSSPAKIVFKLDASRLYWGPRSYWGGDAVFEIHRVETPMGGVRFFLTDEESLELSFYLDSGSYEVLLECSGYTEQGLGGGASAACRLFPADLTCEQDLDANGLIDTADIGLLLLDWGFCPSCQSDLNWDSNVDNGDLSELLLDFGPCYEPPAALAAPAPTHLLADEPAQKTGMAKKE